MRRRVHPDDGTRTVGRLFATPEPSKYPLHDSRLNGQHYWGVPRSTHDIDFVIQYASQNVDQIVRAFEDQFFIQEQSVRSALKPPFQFNALDQRSALKVDFFTIGTGTYEQVRFDRRLAITLLGELAYVARPEDVILYKLRWHQITPSDRQLNDIAGILAVSIGKIDMDYLQQWAKSIGVSQLLQPFLSNSERRDTPAL